MCVNKRRPARQLCKLAEKRAYAMGDNGRVAVQKVVPDHVDLARQDNYQAMAFFSSFHHSLTRAVGMRVAETTYPFNFRQLKDGKQLVSSSVDD